MDNATWIVIIIAIGGIMVGLIAIIYTYLNTKTCDNAEQISHIKEKYVTKEDFNRTNDKVDMKLDKIIDMLVEGRHER